MADLTQRKQQLAARLAGLEQAVKSGRYGRAGQPPQTCHVEELRQLVPSCAFAAMVPRAGLTGGTHPAPAHPAAGWWRAPASAVPYIQLLTSTRTLLPILLRPATVCRQPPPQQSLPPAAPSESQLQTGWMFRSKDEEDYLTAPSYASSAASPSRSPVLVAALLPILVPLSAAAMLFAAKGLDVPIESYLPKQVQVPQLSNLLPKPESLLPKYESFLPKPESLQASLPKPSPPAAPGYFTPWAR